MSKKSQSDIIAASNRRLIIGTLIGAAFVFSGLSLAITIAGYPGPLSPYDGNNAEFKHNSIPNITADVSPSVVTVLGTSGTPGTGFIVSKDGYVITNKHILGDLDNTTITLPDGTIYRDVEIVGKDPLSDVAFLKIKHVNDLPALALGDSSTIRIGQEILAIGNAAGKYQNSATLGIVSSNNRVVNAPENDQSYFNKQLNDMIQTDATIDSSNSGGPLINAAGQVIGINTVAFADDSNSGLAIPINAIKGMLNHLFKTGKFERPFIGVRYTTITPDLAKIYNLSVSSGALLPGDDSVMVGGSADKAGLRPGDLITKIAGKQIGPSGSLFTLIAEHQVGETIDITYLRDGREYTTALKIAPYSGEN